MAVNGRPRANRIELVNQLNIACTGATPATLMTAAQLPSGTISTGTQPIRPVVLGMRGFAEDITFWVRTGTSGTTVFGPCNVTETTAFDFSGRVFAGDWNQGLFVSGSGTGSITAIVDIGYELSMTSSVL